MHHTYYSFIFNYILFEINGDQEFFLTILYAIAVCITLSYKALDVLAFCFSEDSLSYPLAVIFMLSHPA